MPSNDAREAVRSLLGGNMGVDPGEVADALTPLVRALRGRAEGRGGDADAEAALETLLRLRTSDPDAAGDLEAAGEVLGEVSEARERRAKALAVAAATARVALRLVEAGLLA